MVENPGAAPGAGAYQPVNLPEPVVVEADSSGHPVALKIRRRQPITTIEDRWRIDDVWWRAEPVSRVYYAVLIGSGRRLVIYQDLNSNCWYQQSY